MSNINLETNVTLDESNIIDLESNLDKPFQQDLHSKMDQSININKSQLIETATAPAATKATAPAATEAPYKGTVLVEFLKAARTLWVETCKSF